ncbi:hypothetical protein L9G15_27500, partial [Shewanella sp. A3A]|nr:hypothetical protein [Shewanella ferrihydritica]
ADFRRLVSSLAAGLRRRLHIARGSLVLLLLPNSLTFPVAFLAVLAFTISVYIMSRPRPVYLIDFACYKPADELKVS